MNAPVPAPLTPEPKIRLEPPATLLLGPPGTGKSHALVTMIKAGIELFVICTEGRGLETLIDACRVEKADMGKLHWRKIVHSSGGLKSLTAASKLINVSSFEALTKIAGLNKVENSQYLTLLEQLANFKDDRTGQSFGDVTTWGPDRCLAIDSLSGLNDMIMGNTVGQKPVPNQGEWGVAQTQEMNLLNFLCNELNCYVIVTAHQDRVEDEVTKQPRIFPAAIGSKLGPKIGKCFSEMVQTKRTPSGGQALFTWSTLESITDLKNRALPVGSDLAPSFIPLVNAYKQRLASVGAVV